ncbi:hypothetical protein CK203_066528 [Vitis vinifera]|uniref:Uncharacterized protein n=1 Tax=Vitis vinifera TaxID=29760 RepID=A0A438G3S7_VITVI|nr:hypothetical protein CK203_066528 [Vitis vinifera]
MFEAIQYLVSSKKLEDGFGMDNVVVVKVEGKSQAIQYLVSSKKLEDGFGMDNVAVVNGRGKITRSCDDNMGLDLQFIHNNIARILHDYLNNYYGLEMNQTNDFRLLNDVLRDP